MVAMNKQVPAPDIVISANVRSEIAEALNGVLADCFALYLKTKNFHWHVSGAHFRDYHLLFDDHAAQILASTDILAERVRKLGERTLTSIGDVARRQSIVDNDAGNVSTNTMLDELIADNSATASAMRRVHELCANHYDFASASVLESFIDEAEMRVWFLSQAADNP
jgi:starvation-inducible DNA-binding protein